MLAVSWETASPDFPAEIRQMLARTDDPLLADLQILAAVPEYRVELPGGRRTSQTDLITIARNDRGLVVIAVEGKVEEAFGPRLGGKRHNASPGQRVRLNFLHDTLGLRRPAPDSARYQLFHRAASAVLVARQFHAATAVMLVHSFSAARRWFEDFVAFASLLGARAEPDRVIRTKTVAKPALFLGWCTGHRTVPSDIA